MQLVGVLPTPLSLVKHVTLPDLLAFLVFTDKSEEGRLYGIGTMHNKMSRFKNKKVKLSFCVEQFK